MKAVIPSRYEPDRLERLVEAIRPEVDAILVLDNGHDALPELGDKVEVVDARGQGIYAMWNRGREWAGSDKVAILNDDVDLARGVLANMERALDNPATGIAFPGEGTVTDHAGPYRMTGFCFAFRADLPVGPFDEGFEWWCGDTAFERAVLQAGYSVVGVPGKIRHESDAEAGSWARRPELKAAAERDVERWRSMIMRTVILVPRRAGIAERDDIWRWCRARWEALHPDLPIYEGHHDEGPFNRSAAINAAARLADDDGRWDFAVVIDADILLDPANVRRAIAAAAESQKVTWAFGWWAGVDQATTRAILAGDRDPDELVAEVTALHRAGTPNELGHVSVPDQRPDGIEKINPVSWSCCLVVPRGVFDDLGGFDERFSGWGWEDLAWQSAVCGLRGWGRLDGAVLHLWHPRAPGLGSDGVNKRRNRQLGRRYMYALRVKGHHDRTTPADEVTMERDKANLLRLMAQEEHDRRGRPAPDLPDWTGWLPSLEELVTSWKRRETPGPDGQQLAVVVRTGGQAERWPARREYLRQTLATLDENAAYEPTVARVVFSDWPSELTDDLTAIAAKHGFYVVGAADAGGPDFTRSMERLWRYLRTRKWPFAYIFLVEDDFAFERAVDLGAMIRVLAGRPELVQMALLRDACYPAERAKGGILGHPDQEFERVRMNGYAWLEHRRFFTLNPTLFRRRLLDEPWPRAQHSEAVFGRRLFERPEARAGLWGDGEPWIRHLGEVRAGAGY